jgi:4-methyl-5(b-hydroxyethyl)-thiazole monophosphate biosynthesis
MKHKIAILMEHGFEEIEAITQIDLLRRSGLKIISVGVSDSRVLGGKDTVFETDVQLDEIDDTLQAVIVPGGPATPRLRTNTRVHELIRGVYENGGLCAAICAGPSVLGKAGILEGKRVACYPGTEEYIPEATIVYEKVIRDGTVITSRGPGTAIAFGLEIISYLTSPTQADKIQTAILYE